MVRILPCHGANSPGCGHQISRQYPGVPNECGRECRDCKPIRNQWIARLHALFRWKTSMLPTGSHDTSEIRILDLRTASERTHRIATEPSRFNSTDTPRNPGPAGRVGY